MAKRKKKSKKSKRNPEPKIIESPDGEALISIQGYEQTEIDSKRDIGFGDGVEIETDEGDFILFESGLAAGEAAREYWLEMVENEPEEFTTLVGEETLIAWAIGRYAGPGSQKVKNLEEWLDLWLNNPEEQWAGYDGEERDVEALTSEAKVDIGFVPRVAYRTN